MPVSQRTPSRPTTLLAIPAALFFVSFFLYVWLHIDPRLVYHKQCPIFMVDSAFFTGFLVYRLFHVMLLFLVDFIITTAQH